MRSAISYIARVFAIIVMLCGLLAPIAVDARHWMPPNWWPRRSGKDKRGLEVSQKEGTDPALKS
jgi:hypothetical protein